MNRRPVYKRFVAVAMLLLLRIIRAIPLSFGRRAGRMSGRLAYRFLGKRRALAMRNLDSAYGDTLDDAGKRRIIRGAFENLGVVGFEFPHTPELRKAKNRRLVEVRGLDGVDTTKGAIFTCAHLGNWEWMAPPLAALGHPIAEIVNTYQDKFHERVMNSVRNQAGITTVSKTGAVRVYTELLAQKMLVGMIADQSLRRNGVPVIFFGRKCWATPGPAIVALQSGAPVHHASIWRKQDGDYVMEVSPQLSVEVTGDLQHDIQDLTQRIQSSIETAVRAHPEQWMWLHDRWKVPPEDTRATDRRLSSSGSLPQV